MMTAWLAQQVLLHSLWSIPQARTALWLTVQVASSAWRIWSIDPRWTSTDADDLSLVRNGVPTVLLSLPLKYMHTNVETFDMHALEEGGRLLAHYLSAMDASWEEELWN